MRRRDEIFSILQQPPPRQPERDGAEIRLASLLLSNSFCYFIQYVVEHAYIAQHSTARRGGRRLIRVHSNFMSRPLPRAAFVFDEWRFDRPAGRARPLWHLIGRDLYGSHMCVRERRVGDRSTVCGMHPHISGG